MSFWSVKFFCQVVRQGVQKEWVQSRVRLGAPSTQMGQGSFSAEAGGGDGEVEGIFGVDGGAAVPVVVVVAAAAAAAAAAFFSATFSACSVLRRAE